MKGSGNVVSEVRDVSGFDAVELKGIGILTIEQGEREGIEIRADDNLIPEIVTEVKDRRLVITTRNKLFASTRPSRPIEYRVWLRDLTAAILSGAGEIHSAKVVSEDLNLRISGSGKLAFDSLTAVALNAEISGSGSGVVAGAVDRLSIHITGSGDLRADALPCRVASVEVSGSGNTLLNVSDELDIRISGSGRVRYAGSPRISQRITGSGRITRVE
jgi:hypothetical protein